MPPTAVELLQNQNVGELLDHDDVDLARMESAEDLLLFRSHVRKLLEERGSDEQCDDVITVVNEIVVNALVHAHGACSCRLTFYERAVLVEVQDTGPGMKSVSAPTQVEPSPRGDEYHESGRGLVLVAMLSLVWTFASTDYGSAVTALLPLGGGL
ncbi:anti-sigma regulatory factor (Ser/Thr protein kinase) [Streptomyces umbrinus]|uniref:Anti-sigma regulatory factor (Ser/Thr protein kinase) n=1 Tax=Streptomyces umbrinus TaxID=67370 RepID=A0ABU0T734_9ACTN|nr:ATP-binding protein [Streptomyces umbrinus]MDQ1031493.1 anti-sigma regulatory factor (Ser/Thr protein kinase) [Streptomyces umbrinus]